MQSHARISRPAGFTRANRREGWLYDVASAVSRPREKPRGRRGDDPLIPRARDARQRIECLGLPADHHPGAALADPVGDRLRSHLRRMQCQPLVEERRNALRVLTIAHRCIPRDRRLDAPGCTHVTVTG